MTLGKLTKIKSNNHYNIPKRTTFSVSNEKVSESLKANKFERKSFRDVLRDSMTSGQRMEMDSFENLDKNHLYEAILNNDWAEVEKFKNWKLKEEVQEKVHNLEVALAYDRVNGKSGDQWMKAFGNWKLKYHPVVDCPDGWYDMETLHYHSKGWKKDIHCEHYYHLYWFNEVYFSKGKSHISHRKLLNPCQVKMVVCDLVWLAAVGMEVHNTNIRNEAPIWYSSKTMSRAIFQIIFDCSNIYEFSKEWIGKFSELLNHWVDCFWNLILSKIDPEVGVTRCWLQNVADVLNVTYNELRQIKEVRYSAEPDTSIGSCDVDMREDFLMETAEYFVTGEGKDFDGNQQREYIRSVLSKMPNFKPSMIDWTIRALHERVVVEETGEMVGKPYDSSKLCKDYELECVKKEGDVWYFPNKFRTNPSFNRWKVKKQLEVTFRCKYIK